MASPKKRPKGRKGRRTIEVAALAMELTVSVEVVMQALAEAGVEVSSPSSRIDAAAGREALDRHARRRRPEGKAKAPRLHEARVTAVRAHLLDAGLRIRVDGRDIWLGDSKYRLPTLMSTAKPREVVDEAVLVLARRDLVRVMVRELAGKPIRAVPERRGVALVGANGPIGLVTPTRAVFRDSAWPPIPGNYLTSGGHWDALRIVIDLQPEPKPVPADRDRKSEAVSPPKQQRVEITAPEGIELGLLNAAIAASRKIREERSLTFGQPVEVTVGGEKVRFEPVTLARGPLEAPFSYRDCWGPGSDRTSD